MEARRRRARPPVIIIWKRIEVGSAPSAAGGGESEGVRVAAVKKRKDQRESARSDFWAPQQEHNGPDSKAARFRPSVSSQNPHGKAIFSDF